MTDERCLNFFLSSNFLIYIPCKIIPDVIPVRTLSGGRDKSRPKGGGL